MGSDFWAIRARAGCSFSGNFSGNLSFGAPDPSQWLYDLPLSMNNGHLGKVGDSPFMSTVMLSGAQLRPAKGICYNSWTHK